MSTLICHGNVSLSGSNIVKISYGPFTGTPSVTATVVGCEKNGCTVCIKKRDSGSATLAAFYNGGLMLKEGSIDWIAIGPTNKVDTCYACDPPHKCTVCKVFAG